jgi:hypothetical protein
VRLAVHVPERARGRRSSALESSALTGLNLSALDSPHRYESTPLEFCKLSAEDNGKGLGESEAMELFPTLVGIVQTTIVVVSSSDTYGVHHEADVLPRR